MRRFEYQTITLKTGGLLGGKFDPAALNEQFNQQGNLGWELINCFTTNQSSGHTRLISAVFKREK